MIKQMQPFLSVVIPSYNELKNIKRGVLKEVIEYLQQQNFTYEVILTDDGSTDGTVEKLAAFAQQHEHVQLVANIHAGKAPTVTSGMLAARGQWRLFTDFDQSTPLKEVEKLLLYAHDGYPVVIGSREITGALRDEEPIHRHIMGRGFNFFVRTIAVPDIYDTQCGFKLFSAEATEQLFKKLVVYGSSEQRKDAFTGAFDVELLYLARKFGFAVKEVPIRWAYNDTERVSPIKDSVRMFRDIVKIKLSSLTGKYR